MAKKNEKFKVEVNFEKSSTNEIKLLALLFDEKGKLKDRVTVKKNEAIFNIKVTNTRSIKLLIVPDSEEVKKITNYKILINEFKAYKPVINKNINGLYEILPIPNRFEILWPIIKLRVMGNVSKYFDINGFSDKRGLCNARVHICEVDKIKWLISKIPDYIISKIPDLILRPELPFPIPIDPPFPPFKNIEPPRISAVKKFDTIFKASSFNKRTISELPIKKDINISKNIIKEATSNIIADNTIVSSLQTKNPNIIREEILNNFQLFHPLFCYIPWLWAYFYKCSELAVVYTDNEGNFDTNIYYNFLGDKPDLYFWVEVLIDNVWTTVYKPPIPCYVYWNYSNDTEINITVTDPRVRWECNDEIDGQLIWVKTIGHGTSVSHIQQNNNQGLPVQGTSFNRIGLTDKHESIGNFRRPFGKSLYFILQFSSELPSNQYTFYRWSYRKIKNADLSNSFSSIKQLSNTIHKNYSYTFLGSDGNFHFDVDNFKLGPFDIGAETNLYRIPTASPKDAPFNATQADANWDQNTISINFDSNLDGQGLYEFVLELFDSNGNKTNNIPKELFQVPNYNTFAPSVNAPNINLVINGANTCSSFKMVMRIDNDKSEADIYKIKVNGVEKNPTCCGFVKYDPNANIEVSFRAYHPQNFADFNFKTKKGTCNDATQTNKTNVSGMVLAGNNGYSRDGFSVFEKTFTPADLLGICTAEGKAAFAEHLYVNALATNGNNEIDAYDASALAAFALEPS